MRRLVILLLIFGTSLLFSQQHSVYVINVDGAINPASAEFIHDGIESASGAQAECLIIQLNTPGGLLKSTRIIVSDLLTSPIPVIVYVSPSGSQAASAGVFVTLAAHLAVMAPGTNIGAAHPVTLGEQLDSVMMEKATNDAAAFIRTISEKRNRNMKWAEDAVRKSLSITETEALHTHVIDTIAANINDLLKMINGKEIELVRGKKILQTEHAEIITIQKSFQQKILDILSDPNLAYILMMLGIYGILFELYNPGAILPGIVGFISLVLAFYSMHTLPINYAGLSLIIFAVILFLLEIKIVSHGLLAIGGIISLILGSMMLVRAESALDFIGISWKVILAVVVITVLFFVFAIGLGIKAQRRKPTTGIQGIVGEIGVVMNELQPDGLIKIHGELWNATSLDGVVKEGSTVKVESVENLKLNVRKAG